MGEPKDSTVLLPMSETLDEEVMARGVERARANVYRADMRRIAEALGLADSVADIGHILGAIDELAAERDKYEACAMRNRGRIEGEAVKRIVAWLRADAKRCRDRGESWKVPSTDAAVAAHTEIYADAIERGDWRNGGGRDG